MQKTMQKTMPEDDDDDVDDVDDDVDDVDDVDNDDEGEGGWGGGWHTGQKKLTTPTWRVGKKTQGKDLGGFKG